MDEIENQNQEPDNLEEFAPKEPGKNRTPIFIGIAAVLTVFLIFFFIQNKNLKEEVTTTQADLNQTVLQLDSIGSELDKKIIEIQRLGGDIDTLLVVKEQLEQEKRSLLTTNQVNRSTIQSLQDKVDGYSELLVLKDQEIEQLQAQNEVLMTENTVLKTEKNILSDSISSITQNAEELTEQVAIASKLKVEGVMIYAVSDGGREREDEFRNRHIDNLKIEFTVAENRVAPIEGKELLIRIIAPDNNVLFDVTRGSGSFTFEGRELFYTAKKEILYDRSSQSVSMLYNKGSDYESGQYIVEIYTDEYLMGKGSFVVK